MTKSLPTVDLSAIRFNIHGCIETSTAPFSKAETSPPTPSTLQNDISRILINPFQTLGCVRLVNHGIDETLLEKVFQASHSFFALDESTKLKYAYQGHESNRGYIGYGKESHHVEKQQQLPQTNVFDRKETFDSGKEREATFQTPWPAEPGTSFRNDLLEYFERMDKLHLELLRLIALGLGLSDLNYFVDRCNEQHCNLRLLHYPQEAIDECHARTNDNDLRQDQTIIRGARHTDFGTLTLLLQDATGGLRVQTSQGDWMYVEAVPGSIIVQVGDMLQRWTGNVLRAAPHQVVQPLAHGKEDSTDGKRILPERFSVAFFCNANKNILIETVALPDYESHTVYPPIQSLAYLTQRLNETIKCDNAM